MNIPLVDLKANYLAHKADIDAAIAKVLDHCWFINGPEVKEFEESFAKFVEAKYCVGVSSGTAAIHLACKAHGIGPGDEVIMQTNTFIATADQVQLTGATPVFVDIESDYYNIDPEKIEAAITPKTKAIIAVHLYGHPCDMDKIKLIADKHNLILIEDAAQAHGTEYKGVRIGNLGQTASFSMFPAKILGAYGDAGAVVSNDEKIAEFIRMYKDHGRTSKYESAFVGDNNRLDTMQAAILLAKMKHIESWIKKRRALAAMYNDLLPKSIIIPKESPDAKHAYYMYVVQCEQRDELMAYLKENNIASGIHYPVPLHLQELYADRGFKEGDFPVAEHVAKKIVSLPLYPEMSEDQLKQVVKVIQKFTEGS